MMQFIKVYRGPFIAVGIWFGIAFYQFGPSEFLTALWCIVQDKNWWVENTFSVIIFTVLIAWVVNISERHREQANKAPYEGRFVILKGLIDEPKPQGIHWQDAQKNDISSFEKWKFIKSALSSICWIKTPTMQEAENRWVSYSNNGRNIVIDFSKMKREDIDKLEDWEDLQKKIRQNM